jgi:hypothetical protein
MSYEPTRHVQVAWSRPPRCLAGFAVEAVKAPPFERVLNEQAFFQLSCPCGSTSMRILGYPNERVASYLLCPLSAQCVACERVISLFDAREHGYDGEHGYSGYSERAGGEPRPFGCPQCAGVVFAAYAAFSYEMEEDEAEELEAARPGRLPDLFDWFILHVRCEHCGILTIAADYECA